MDVERAHLFVLGLCDHPYGVEEWEVPVHEVNAAVAQAFDRWDVWRLYADPPYWESTINAWAGKYGDTRVVEWWTNRNRQIGHAVRSFHNAMVAGEFTHDGDKGMARHIGNAVKKDLRIRDDEDKPLWAIQKERPDSPKKIDCAMAGVLAWECYGDALSAGASAAGPSVYESRGIRTA